MQKKLQLSSVLFGTSNTHAPVRASVLACHAEQKVKLTGMSPVQVGGGAVGGGGSQPNTHTGERVNQIKSLREHGPHVEGGA